MKDVLGIILKERNYGESSKILDVFTKEYGIIGVISKGSKKIKSTLSGVSTKMTYGVFHIYYKENKLSTLTGVDIINPFMNIKNSIIITDTAQLIVITGGGKMITISNPTKYIAGLYVRLSNEKIEEVTNTNVITKDIDVERESGSITNQKIFLKNFCRDSEIEVYKIYSDDGYSGANFDRPGFKEMIKDIEAGKINIVLVKDLSRLREGIIKGNILYR